MKSNPYRSEMDRKRKLKLNVGAAHESEFSPSERFRIEVFSPILDRLHIEIKKRLEAYINLSNRFGFLHNVQQLDAKQLRDEADNLVQLHPEDLRSSFAEELVHFREYLKGKFSTYGGNDAVSNEFRMCLILIRRRVRQVFPNVEIAL